MAGEYTLMSVQTRKSPAATGETLPETAEIRNDNISYTGTPD